MEANPGMNISGIKIHVPDAPRPFWLTALLAFLAILVVFAIQSVFTLWYLNRDVISWWQQGAKLKSYNRFMSIWLVLAQGQGSKVLSAILRIFYSPSASLTTGQTVFMRQKLLVLRRYIDPKTQKQMGILTPSQLCDSILLYTDDQDDAFDAWLKAHPARKTGPRLQKVADFDLVFDKAATTTSGGVTFTDFTGKAQPLKTGGTDYGVYPGIDFNDWMGCIQAWANGGLTAKQVPGKSFYMWTLNTGFVEDAGADMFVLKDVNNVNDQSAWWDTTAQPDNVFARYGILFNSPLVIAFVNQKAYFSGVTYEFDAQAFSNLVGANKSGANPGGWVALLKGFGDKSDDAFQNLCFRSVDMRASSLPPGPPCNLALNIGAAVGTALGTGALLMGGAFPEGAAAAAETTEMMVKTWSPFAAVTLFVVALSTMTIWKASNSC
jgi:hypothetical protein